MGNDVLQASAAAPQSLQNVAPTAPYMHDGSLATLEDVIHKRHATGGMASRSAHGASPIREGTFPPQVKIGTHGAGWHESAINAWIADPAGWHRTARASNPLTDDATSAQAVFPDRFRAA